MLVKAKCKRCGREAPVEEFTLDPDYKLMVCRACVKEKKNPKPKTDEIKMIVEDQKPAGWDHEDEILERMSRQKEKSIVKAKKIDTERVQYTCPMCKFSFVYNMNKKQPPKCPYCMGEIANFALI